MNTPVSYAIAKLLNEKGFEVKVRPMYYFDKSIRLGSYMYNANGVLEQCTMPEVGLRNGWIDSPTIADVVMWFKDVKKIQLFLDFNYYDGFHYGIKYVMSNGKFGEIWRDNNEYPDGYDSWEEAYEAAFDYVLKMKDYV